MAGGNKRKGANVLVLHRFVLLLTKGGRPLFTELLPGLGEGVAVLTTVAEAVWT